MQKISILVDNNYLDLFDTTDFTITKQSLILGDIANRKMGFTSNIKIPTTEYNKNVLGIASLVANTANIRQFIPNVNLEFENIQIIVNGYLRITTIARDYIEISLLQDLKDITQRLGYKNLKDIRLQTQSETVEGALVSNYEIIDYTTGASSGTYDVLLYNNLIQDHPVIIGSSFAPSFDTHQRYINKDQRYKVYFQGLDSTTSPSKYLSWKEILTSPIINHEEVEVFETGRMPYTESVFSVDAYLANDMLLYPNAVATLHSIFAQVFESVDDIYDTSHSGGFLVTGKVLDELSEVYFTHASPYNYYGETLSYTGTSGDGYLDWNGLFAPTPAPIEQIGTPTNFVPTTSTVTNFPSANLVNFFPSEQVIYTHSGPVAVNINLNFTTVGNVIEEKTNRPAPTLEPIEITRIWVVIVRHYDSTSTLLATSTDNIIIPTLNPGDYLTVETFYRVSYLMPPGVVSSVDYTYTCTRAEVSMSQAKYGNQLPYQSTLTKSSVFYDLSQLEFVKEFCKTFLLNFDILYNQPVLDKDNNLLGYTNTIEFWRMSEILENIGSAYDWTHKVNTDENGLLAYEEVELHPDDYSQLSYINFSNYEDYPELAEANKFFTPINILPDSLLGTGIETTEKTITGNTVTHFNGFQIPIFVNDETLNRADEVVSLKSPYFYTKFCRDTTTNPLTFEYGSYLHIPSFTKSVQVPTSYDQYDFKSAEFGFFEVQPFNLQKQTVTGSDLGSFISDLSLADSLIPSSPIQDISLATKGRSLIMDKSNYGYIYNNISEFLKNNIFSDYQRVKIKVKITLDEINNFRFKYPVYLAQTASYYYVEKIEGYSSKDELSTVYLIKLTIN